MAKSDVIGKVYYYDNGQTLAEFRRGGPRDWFVWSPKRGQRLATYVTRRELLRALQESDNTDGAYGLAQLRLLPGEW